MIREIVQIGVPILSKKALKVRNPLNQQIQSDIQDLIDTMRSSSLIGIAAPQIWSKWQIFVTEIRETPYRDPKQSDKLRIFINPVILNASKKQVVAYEWCWSVANTQIFAPVKRSKSVMIEALDQAGKPFVLEADGLLARLIQHEYDHLQGIHFLEKVTDAKKILSAEVYKKKFLVR